MRAGTPSPHLRPRLFKDVKKIQKPKIQKTEGSSSSLATLCSYPYKLANKGYDSTVRPKYSASVALGWPANMSTDEAVKQSLQALTYKQ